MNRPALADAFGHHVWATVRIIEACELLTSEQLTAAVPGTYGPIMDTLRHLVAADRGYLSLFEPSMADVDEETIDLATMRSIMHENDITGIVIDTAIAVHKSLGPGLLESVYEVVLTYELRKRGLKCDRQIAVPIVYNEN